MISRRLKLTVSMFCGVLLAGTVMAQSAVGDWRVAANGDGAEAGSRSAYTLAYLYPDGSPVPKLEIRRKKPGAPVELLVTSTHVEAQDKCEYKDWKLTIDRTEIPVLGYSFEPAKTVLKASWVNPEEELWELFRKGLKLEVQVEQKCDSLAREPHLKSYGFSLRGSNAAYQFVSSGDE